MDKSIFRSITYGMYIVTTIDENNQKVGCVINTLNQITSEQPIIAISLNKNNYTNKAIKQSKKFAISILSTTTPKDIISTFGYYTSLNKNKFNNINYELKNNIPIITENTCGYIIAELLKEIDCNTHDIILAKVIDTKKISNLEPMTYKYYHQNLKGTSPKNAPTYIEENTTINSKESKYQCNLCGYIYDDSKEKIKFSDLPDDWKCPICGAPKSEFTKIN